MCMALLSPRRILKTKSADLSVFLSWVAYLHRLFFFFVGQFRHREDVSDHMYHVTNYRPLLPHFFDHLTYPEIFQKHSVISCVNISLWKTTLLLFHISYGCYENSFVLHHNRILNNEIRNINSTNFMFKPYIDMTSLNNNQLMHSQFNIY